MVEIGIKCKNGESWQKAAYNAAKGLSDSSTVKKIFVVDLDSEIESWRGLQTAFINDSKDFKAAVSMPGKIVLVKEEYKSGIQAIGKAILISSFGNDEEGIYVIFKDLR